MLCGTVRVPCESPHRKRDVRQTSLTCSFNAAAVWGPSYSCTAGGSGSLVACSCSIGAVAGVGEQEKQSQDSGGVGGVESKVRPNASPRTSRDPARTAYTALRPGVLQPRNVSNPGHCQERIERYSPCGRKRMRNLPQHRFGGLELEHAYLTEANCSLSSARV